MIVELDSVESLLDEMSFIKSRGWHVYCVRCKFVEMPLQKEAITFEVGAFYTFVAVDDSGVNQVLYELVRPYGQSKQGSNEVFELRQGERDALTNKLRDLGIKVMAGRIESI